MDEMQMKISNTTSRTKNFILNVFFGYISQIVALILSFVNRKIFVSFLPLEYLGINGLYTNILTVLSLTEMGLDTAFVYFLYKPISENNSNLVSSMLSYFSKLYIRIASLLIGIAFCIIPFLKYIINLDNGLILQDKDIIFYYIIFLLNTTIPYLFAQYSVLLSASQLNRVKHNLTLLTNILLQIIHLLALCFFRTYEAYVLVTLIMTVFHCILLRILTRKRYPSLFDRNRKQVTFDKQIIWQKVKSTILYKFGAVAVNNTDNILISILVSTPAVGLYSNYNTLVAAIQGLIAIVSNSFISGLGNMFAEEGNREAKEKLFYSQLYVYHLVGAIGFIGFFLLSDKFVALWLGSKYVMGKRVSFSIALCFYLTNISAPIWINREANGLFEKVKYLMIARAIINLVLSIFLGKILGTFGIILATSISILLTSFWIEPRILFKTVFHISTREYWKKQIMYVIISISSFALLYFVDRIFNNTIVYFALETIIIILVCALTFSLYASTQTEGRFLIQRVRTLFGNKGN